MTIKLETAQKFFDPMYYGDSSAFQPYKLGEVAPDPKDMDAFIESVFDGVDSYLEGLSHTEHFGTRGTLAKVKKAYAEDLNFSEQLRAWCFKKASDAYNA